MKRIEVKSKEYKVCNVADELFLYTVKLDSEIACSFFSVKLKKVALARNVSSQQLKQLIQELNSDNLIEPGLIQVQIVGGDKSALSQQNLEFVIQELNSVDSNTDVINIVSCDTGERFHPNSFELNCYHGHINQLVGDF